MCLILATVLDCRILSKPMLDILTPLTFGVTLNYYYLSGTKEKGDVHHYKKKLYEETYQQSYCCKGQIIDSKEGSNEITQTEKACRE